MSRKSTSRKVSRRAVLAGTAAGAAAVLTRFPTPAIAQAEPFKLGLLTVKTGPLAQGGIQMEQGVLTFLKEKNYTMAGRKVDFISGDTGGNPAGAKTKAQELIERDKVNVILGPLAAFELLAILDYVREKETPLISEAAAKTWMIGPTASVRKGGRVVHCSDRKSWPSGWTWGLSPDPIDA